LRDELVRLTQRPDEFLDSPDATLRRMAVTALSQTDTETSLSRVVALATDEDPSVRAAVAETLGSTGTANTETLHRLGGDTEATVREAVATAFGETGDPSAIGWLIDTAGHDPDRQVREAAVAALGAIGDPSAIDPLLEFVRDGPPQVRRRAIAAITVFDDDRIEPALRLAALDRNPGVKEAAEMVVGRQLTDGSS
jgi:HEAT repeat protein